MVYYPFLGKVTMKILFLIPYPVDQAPSQRFRFEQYLRRLEEIGFQLVIESFWGEKTWSVLYKQGHTYQKIIGFLNGFLSRCLMMFRLTKIDYVFVHRECLPIGPPVIEWIIAKISKKKIIYDFDDAIWLPNTSQENKMAAFLKWHSKVAAICKWSYKVSCGNSFLANYARQFNKNVIISPTTIDTNNVHNPALFSVDKKSTAIVIGWTGSQSTLPYLEPFVSTVKKLEAKFPGKVRLLIIANKDPQFHLDFIDFIPWSKRTEVGDLLKIDIGIMPLTDDIWAKGKCGFKALQYMSLEIPALVSPVGVNTEIVENGLNGYWCATEADWIHSLEKLITNSEERKKMGLAGRKKVVASYSVTSNSSTFLGLFS